MQKIVLLGLILSLALPSFVGAQQGIDGTFTSSDGLFSVPIPTNWTAEETEGIVVLSAPEGAIRVSIFSVPAKDNDLQSAIDAGWARIDPAFDFSAPLSSQFAPPAALGAWEEGFIITYQINPDVVQALALRHEGYIYLQYWFATLVAAQERAAQINIINTGFRASAMMEESLAETPPQPIDAAFLADFEAYIEEAMALYQTPGASVAIVQNGEIVYSRGFGLRSLAATQAVDPDTLMMIGSVSKTMTAFLMGTAVDAGTFTWETPVTEVWPAFQVGDADLTARLQMQHLLCACTGIPRRDFEMILNAEGLSAEGVLESLADFTPFTAFGEAFQYSNQMVAAGGYLTALASGGKYGNLYAAYDDLIQERLFAPLGMERTVLSVREAEALGNFAYPHTVNLDNQVSAFSPQGERWVEPVAPAGAVWSSAHDMARYALMLLAKGQTPDGTRLISAKALNQVWTPQITVADKVSYGLGWILEDRKGLTVLSHSGGTFGFSSYLELLPDAQAGIVVLSNQVGSPVPSLAAAYFFERLYGQEVTLSPEALREQVAETEAALAERNAKRFPLTADLVASLEGLYRHPLLGDIRLERLEVAGERLFMDTGEINGELLGLTSEDGTETFIINNGVFAGATFTRGADGSLTLGEGVLEYVFEKVE
jgi:CubicO group peptidase (beta-lactamase class C family)